MPSGVCSLRGPLQRPWRPHPPAHNRTGGFHAAPAWPRRWAGPRGAVTGWDRLEEGTAGIPLPLGCGSSDKGTRPTALPAQRSLSGTRGWRAVSVHRFHIKALSGGGEAFAVEAAFTSLEWQRTADHPARGLQGPSDPKVTLTAELVSSHLFYLKKRTFKMAPVTVKRVKQADGVKIPQNTAQWSPLPKGNKASS